MGKLIRNGIEYGGGNGTDIFEVTQAEYDALVQAGTLVHNALYVITDAPNLNETAQDISYDGSTDTVWDKVEEVNNLPRPTTSISSARSDVVQWNTSVVPNTRAGTINVFFVFNNTGTAQPMITHTITCNRNILSMSMIGFNMTTGTNSATATYDNGNIKWNTGLLQGVYICMGTVVFE
jgi:hypothetical protein